MKVCVVWKIQGNLVKYIAMRWSIVQYSAISQNKMQDRESELSRVQFISVLNNTVLYNKARALRDLPYTVHCIVKP